MWQEFSISYLLLNSNPIYHFFKKLVNLMYVTLNSCIKPGRFDHPCYRKADTHTRLTIDRAAILSLIFLRTGVHFCTFYNMALQPTVLWKVLSKCQRITQSSAPPEMHWGGKESANSPWMSFRHQHLPAMAVINLPGSHPASQRIPGVGGRTGGSPLGWSPCM